MDPQYYREIKNKKYDYMEDYMKRITSVLLIFVMLFGAVSFTGCREEYALEIGEFGYDSFITSQQELGIRSKNNVFSKNSINFDIYIGLKEVQHPIKRFFTNLTADSSREPYIEPEYANKYYLIGMWALTDYTNARDHSSRAEISIEDFYVFNEVSYIEVIKNDTYDFYRSRFTGINYNSCENIAVPQSLIDRELANDDAVYHSIVVAIVEVQKNSAGEYEDAGNCSYTLELRIRENEDGTVTLC